MTTFEYNNTVPATNDRPAADQPLMLQNTQSINSIINVDHYSFGQGPSTNDGIHKQATMLAGSAPSLPAGNYGAYFSNLVSANAWPAWTNSAGTFNLMQAAPVASANGYIYLPGSILMQWGDFNPNSSTSVSFNIAFPNNVWNIQLTGSASNNSSFRNGVSTGTVTLSGFTWQGTVDSHWTPIYWLAIGN
jgi:hypothetical protein